MSEGEKEEQIYSDTYREKEIEREIDKCRQLHKE